MSLFRIFDAVMALYVRQSKEVSDDDDKKGNPLSPKDSYRGIFFFSLIWSVGASCDLEGRRKFNVKFRELVAANGHERLVPENGSVYDYCFLSTFKTADWMPWMNTRPEFKLVRTLLCLEPIFSIEYSDECLLFMYIFEYICHG
jgi:dynein heavy chain